jgi:hypothetical protein
VPTALVPISGSLLFVFAEVVRPTHLGVEGLLSIYASMGITAAQFLGRLPGRAAHGDGGQHFSKKRVGGDSAEKERSQLPAVATTEANTGHGTAVGLARGTAKPQGLGTERPPPA